MAKKRLFVKIIERSLIVVSVIIITSLIVRAMDKKIISKDIQNDACPEDMVFIPSINGGFCLDKYEASPGVKCIFDDPLNQRETRTNLNIPNCKPVSKAGLIPWRNISQNQAAEACAKAGKRLPSNKEWQLASLGMPDISSDWGSDDCQVANNWNKQPGLTGSAKKCISSAGAYDMIGNVWEWVDGNVNNGKFEGVVFASRGLCKRF